MLKIIKNLTALSLLLSLPSAVLAQENLTPQQLVTSMTKAQTELNYQISFVQTNLTDLQAFRYKHVNLDNKSYAQLTTLESSQQDIIRRDNLVSYFQSNFTPFTIQSNHIIDYLPNILSANIEKFAENYDFSALGRNRVADRLVQVIRIMPKDDFRYQYVLFIDEETHLLLRSDLIDRNDNLLESFHVVNLYIGDEIKSLVEQLNAVHFPPLLTDESNEKPSITSWQTKWLPKGFTLVSENADPEDIDGNNIIESRLYSDGLFSFTIYVADKIINGNQDNLWRQGMNTIYSENIGDKEVTLIGQIPSATAKRIVQDLQFK
ncbi:MULTISPECIES: sigma-E factor regulatory protein RseB [unclassified Lonepinella]|uniref:sigma-E factor regulatory protein RseB n=1 Tax=unclassified Lonepinella TaxID=2642006 RepID=UPI0036DC9869